jgi:hypothetical protein
MDELRCQIKPPLVVRKSASALARSVRARAIVIDCSPLALRLLVGVDGISSDFGSTLLTSDYVALRPYWIGDLKLFEIDIWKILLSCMVAWSVC